MAEIILTPLAELIIRKLASFASDQVLLLQNLKPEILKLQDTVTSIQAVLLDAEQKQSHNNQIKLWLERLSDFMYDADDLLDDFSAEVLLRQRAVAGRRMEMQATYCCWVCSLLSFRPKQLMYDYKMARGIKAIREKLDVISKEKENFNLEVLPEEVALPSRETDRRPPTIVVGREDDKKEIIHLLLNSNSEANISAVSIVGMGGLGKTTLAQLISNDEQVNAHFDITAWVFVSPSFDVKAILGKMLRSIHRQSQAGPELDDLQALLGQKIKGKRFLLILDDVWEETSHSWETLAKYLTDGVVGSKVLVTTRSLKVAEAGRRALNSRTSTNIVEPYCLKGLSKEESWKLLEEKALPRKVPQDPRVQEVGKQILEKCGGVPLAVSTIAGVLVDSTNPNTEWQSFLDKSISSIGKQEKEDPTMSTLLLSFNHLPSQMKHCFTYCKVFSKGSRIDIKQLLRFWVAQGYVESEDKGLGCFHTLWWRSFFQEVEMDGLGNMSKCRMHDLMHDLVDTIAGGKIIRSSSSTILQNIPSKTRHLMIDNDDSDSPREGDLRNASQVRSLICYLFLSREELKQILNTCLRLRSLVITKDDPVSCGEDNSVSDASIDKLKHLRYFCFNCTGKRTIPDSVTNLINLQVLHLFNCESIEELPRDIKKLVNLRHIEVNLEVLDQPILEKLTHMPKGIGELQFLQTLPVFVVGKRNNNGNNNGEMVWAGLDELKGLNALHGELEIKGLANIDSPIKDVLKKKLHLQSLILNWGQLDDNYDDIALISTRDEGVLEMLLPHPNLKKLEICRGYQGRKIPDWLSSLTNLVVFSLKNCNRCEYLPPLHELPSLRELRIWDCPELKGCWWKKTKKKQGNSNTDDDDYYNFDPNSMQGEETKEEEEAEWPCFPCLSILEIGYCEKLTRMPLFPTVEGKLILYGTSAEALLVRTMKMKVVAAPNHHSHLHSQQHSTTTTTASTTTIATTTASPSSSSSSSSPLPRTSLVTPPLSKLSELVLGDMEDLEPLLEEGLRNLTSLRELSICDFPRLASLPPAMCNLTSLRELEIWDCPRLASLPPAMCNLTSLRELSIGKCPRLASLPPAMRHLTSLQWLFVSECPLLSERCRKGEGEDWPNISHIPNIELEGDWIQ